MKKSRQPSPPCMISKEPYKKDCIMQMRPMNVLALMTRPLASVQKALVALWLIWKGSFGSDETHTCIISKDSCGSFWKDGERGALICKSALFASSQKRQVNSQFHFKRALQNHFKRAVQNHFKRALQTKEASPTCPFWIATSHFKEPTNHSYPIVRVSQEPKHS